MDIAYFEYYWLEQKLKYVVEECNASVGYSTCFWNNVINSIIVYDKDNKFKDLQEKYTIPYPEELKINIIRTILMIKHKRTIRKKQIPLHLLKT